MSTTKKHLYYLSELKDYKVNSKDHDIRGWGVMDLDNRKIGKVDNLLVNMELGKVVYVDVEVDQSIIDTNHDPYSANSNSDVKEFINKDGENHIIIPIGLTNLNKDDKYVYTESINYQTFAETKRYRSGSDISRDYEHDVLDSYDRKNDRERDNDLKRTRTAYEDRDRENIDSRKDVDDDRTHDRSLEHNDNRLHADRSSNETEDRMRREKENMRYESKDHNRPIDDHDRASHHHDTSRDLKPERTLDDDSNWTKSDRDIEEQNRQESARRKRRDDDDFYDRNEFRNKNY